MGYRSLCLSASKFKSEFEFKFKSVIVLAALATVTILSLPSALHASSHATGAPLVYRPIEPCRVLDTNYSLGSLPAGGVMDVYVRGSNLPSYQGGAKDCKVPTSAQMVMVNIAVVNPTGNGYLKANATGWLTNPNSIYSRLNYTTTENVSNELAVGVCNIYLYAYPHQPCGGSSSYPGTYADFQVSNHALSGTSARIIVDVTGYFEQMTLTSAVSGIVESKEYDPNSGNDPNDDVYTLTLDNGLKVACRYPYADFEECNVLVGKRVTAAGHVENSGGVITIWAHNEVGQMLWMPQ